MYKREINITVDEDEVKLGLRIMNYLKKLLNILILSSGL